MFPTFISILDIQSWWEVPSIAHFCSLFRTAFNLLDFDIEDLEEALLTDGTEETSWLQDLIVRLLRGCLSSSNSNGISTSNYQMFLRRLFRRKCQKHNRYNPFNTDIDFQLLPLRTKVDILHALCDFRLDAEDVLDRLKNFEADSLRVEPLGYDSNSSAYWYFYGTRLYREDFKTRNNKKDSVWQVICFTEDDWFQLTQKFKNTISKEEKLLHRTLSENFLPELPRLFKEKENLARKRLLESLPRRTSNRIRQLGEEAKKKISKSDNSDDLLDSKSIDLEKIDDLSVSVKKDNSEDEEQSDDNTSLFSETSVHSNEMAGTKINKKSTSRQRKTSTSSVSSKDNAAAVKSSSTRTKKNEKKILSKTSQKSHATSTTPTTTTTVGRQTNNSLSAATGQILIQPLSEPHKKKLKTSQVFRQTDEDLQTGMHKILDMVKDHEDAWPFAEPVEEEYAPNYYTIIRKPMDLQTMEERLDSGYYKTFIKFRADFQLIIDNCRLYNGAANEYTEMVDNLSKVFDRATEKYLDQISSSDDEIAIEFSNSAEFRKNARNKPVETTSSRRKPTLVAQTDNKKRERSLSEHSATSKSDPFELKEDFEDFKSKKSDPVLVVGKKLAVKNNKSKKEKEKKTSKKDKLETKKDKLEKSTKKENHESKKEKDSKKNKEKKSKSKKSAKKEKDKKKSIIKTRSPSCSPSRSPRSNLSSPPPSWPGTSPDDDRFDYVPPNNKKPKRSVPPPLSNISHHDFSDSDDSFSSYKGKYNKKKSSRKYDDDDFDDEFNNKYHRNSHLDKKMKKDYYSPPPAPPSSILTAKPQKDKHNKLRETIEKLKAKSEMKLLGLHDDDDDDDDGKDDVFNFELDHPKENKEKIKKPQKEDAIISGKCKTNTKNKDKATKLLMPLSSTTKKKSKDIAIEMDFDTSTMDSIQSFEEEKVEGKRSKRHATTTSVTTTKHHTSTNMMTKTSNLEALSIATEQTLKDINKWLDDTPKFAEFSSASNSPSYTGPLVDEFDVFSGGGVTGGGGVVGSVVAAVGGTGGGSSVVVVGGSTAKMDQLSLPSQLKKITDGTSNNNNNNNTSTTKSAVTTTMTLTATTTTSVGGAVGGGVVRKEATSKDSKKRSFRDPSKFFKRREVQRTIDRLQPGKSKGNLISNVQNTNKTEEIFPLGPLSKIKDTKNSLIVKTDTNAPKLSLGSVLDSFGKHKFVDDQKKEEQIQSISVLKEENQQQQHTITTSTTQKESMDVDVKTLDDVKDFKDVQQEEKNSEKEPSVLEDNVGGATPNLSAWFKAFGAPKTPAATTQKKTDSIIIIKPDGKENEKTEEKQLPTSTDAAAATMIRKVVASAPLASPNNVVDSSSCSSLLHGGQPIPRQRRISTGSSMSERSSFSQDMDSPRVGMEERGAYPAPYPSPLHRSPSGASPVIAASPRPDISPKSAASYPTINGQMRVGFYQDTVVSSNKSSPDKSCSPRENPQSPYSPHYSEQHVYVPNTTTITSTGGYYSYANSPYYSHAALPPPNYSSTNPTPPYNMDGSYYDTSKSLTEQYQAKSSAVGGGSNHSSPAHIMQHHSPNMNPHSPAGGIHSPHSPSIYSQHSPTVTVHPQHSPSIPSPISIQNPPSVHSQQQQQHSPSVLHHSPRLVVQADSPEVDLLSPPQHQEDSKQMQQTQAATIAQAPLFPVKKRAYNNDMPTEQQQQQQQRYIIDTQRLQRHNQRPLMSSDEVIELDLSPEPSPSHNNTDSNLDHQTQDLKHQTDLSAMRQQDFVVSTSTPSPYNNVQQHFNNNTNTESSNYHHNTTPLVNIPLANNRSVTAPLQQQLQQQQHQQNKLDMSKYTNMGYTGPDVNLTRSLQQHYNKSSPHVAVVSSAAQQQQASSLTPTTNSESSSTISSSSSSTTTMRYGDPNTALQQMGYKSMEMSLMSASNPPQQAHTNYNISNTQRSNTNNTPTGYNSNKPPDVTIPTRSSTYNASTTLDVLDQQQHQQSPTMLPSLGLSRNMSNHHHLSHIVVDRLSNEEHQRLIAATAGLQQQQQTSYYADKGLSTAHHHMFSSSKALPTSVATTLPMFSQANIAAMQSYNQSVQQSQQQVAATSSIYNNNSSRQMSELQNPAAMMQSQNDAAVIVSSSSNSSSSSAKVAMQQSSSSSSATTTHEKKTKKRKSKSTAAISTESSQMSASGTTTSTTAQANHQGFQSYAGLKGNNAAVTATTIEPSAISLKSSSVVPGSAFNFGPPPTGLGIGSALYGDKDAYPNFLEEFRSAPNYYMAAAAAAHHRPTPEPSDKQTGRTSLQNSNVAAVTTGGYHHPHHHPSFLGGGGGPTQPRPTTTYPPIGASPFIPSAAAQQLMDTSSPLYQQYIQAGLLNQGLLGPPGAYPPPPGYHAAAALTMRQQYDSMSRPTWL